MFRNFHKFKNIEGIDELLSKGGSWKRSDEICTYINHLSEETRLSEEAVNMFLKYFDVRHNQDN